MTVRRFALLLLTLAVLLGAGGCGAGGAGGAGNPDDATASGSGPVSLTILTYNIHHGEGTDGKLDLERIARIIRTSEADLVALQEVDQGAKRTGGVDQPAELARMLGMHVVYGPAMDFQGGKYGDAILSKLPAPSASRRVVQLGHQPGEKREPRVAVSATVGGNVQFISTHLDHTREPSDRLAQAEAINRELAGGSAPAILAGDFNCEVGSPPMEELARHWTLVSGAGSSFGGPGKAKSIDHVLVRPGDRWRVMESRVIDEPVASDHLPVLVRLELLPPKK